MTYEELAEWFEENRAVDLAEAKTREALREVFRREAFLVPKARAKLFEIFVHERPESTGLGEGLPRFVHVETGPFNWGEEGVRYRDERTGRFVSL
jgi:hypothetical protein